jgi:hypothetical protein
MNHIFPPLFRNNPSNTYRGGRETTGTRGFQEISLPMKIAVILRLALNILFLTMSHSHLSHPTLSQESLLGSSGVPGKFNPGQETESVIKLTKRPKLREKDVAHRRSLGQGDQPAASRPAQYDSLVGLFPSTVLASHFVVFLTFGSRKVGVPGSPFMTVADLRDTAGAIAECDPASLRLMHGDIPLGLGSTLNDYAAFITTHPHAFHVTVASANVSSPVRMPAPHLPAPTGSLGFCNNLTTAQPGVIAASSLARTSFTTPSSATESSFLILVVFEDGGTMAPVVSASTTVRQLCQQIGNFANVSPDTVFLQFAGSVLEVTRCMSDPPSIRAGARVYAFFTIARTMRFVVHLMQGGSPPPPNPPARTPAPFGPPLLPGYGRAPPASTPGPSPGTDPNLPTGSSTASDKLRSTFKCPKFQGDARHWKGWNQRFIRFLAINKLDHVIEENFPKMCYSRTHQEDN